MMSRHSHQLIFNTSIENKLEDLIPPFWKTEDMPCKISKSHEEEHYDGNTKRLSDERFVVKLSFSADPSVLGNSKDQGINPLTFMVRKLAKGLELKESYTEFLNEHLGNDEMEGGTEDNEPRHAYHLPHHP